MCGRLVWIEMEEQTKNIQKEQQQQYKKNIDDNKINNNITSSFLP